MVWKNPKREEFKLEGDQVTHVPTGKWYGAHPGMPNISHENTVDVDDYNDNEIRQMAERILAGRLE